MKDRTREALFNLLGGSLEGFVCIDLFAGSGILSFESLSRSALHAVAIELNAGAWRDLKDAAASLDLAAFSPKQGDAFYFSQSVDSWIGEFKDTPWCVYVCPPYSLWRDRTEDCRALIASWCQRAPDGSLIAVEFEEPAPIELLPENWRWDVRTYRPAVLAIGDRPSPEKAS